MQRTANNLRPRATPRIRQAWVWAIGHAAQAVVYLRRMERSSRYAANASFRRSFKHAAKIEASAQ